MANAVNIIDTIYTIHACIFMGYFRDESSFLHIFCDLVEHDNNMEPIAGVDDN